MERDVMAHLSGTQIDELKKALSSAVNFADLDRWVHIGTGDQLCDPGQAA